MMETTLASKRRHLRRASLRYLSILITVVAATACGEKKEVKALPEVVPVAYPVRAMKPATEATSGETKVTSTLRSKSEATISAKTTGQILKLDVRVGDRVKAGQLLVRVDSAMASIQLQNAKAAERLAQVSRANAKAELERAKALQEQGALSEANFDKMQLMFDLASAQTDQATVAIRASGQQIADATITAPFAGVISARFRNLGDTVSGMPPTPLLSIVDPDHLEVRMAVPEALAPMLRHGNVLSATESPSGTPFQVRVSALGATVDPMSRTVEVLADVVEPVHAALKHGALATVDVAQSDGMKGLYVPAAAMHEFEGASCVLVVVGDRLQRRPVTSTMVRPGTFLVSSGLSGDDLLALDAASIPEGQAVRVLAD